MMNLDDIRQILELVREHELAEFELERDGLRVRIRKQGETHVVAPVPATGVSGVAFLPHGAVASQPILAATAASAAATDPFDGEFGADGVELAVVKSPMVGTFYRAPEPGAPPFVDVGATVKKGQVLCIIEAMKLMNEIEAEYEGELVKVYVDNGQPVQFGERLFAIKAS